MALELVVREDVLDAYGKSVFFHYGCIITFFYSVAVVNILSGLGIHLLLNL